MAQPALPTTARLRIQQRNFLEPGMKIATYHDHDVGSFLHAGALAYSTKSLAESRGSRRRYAINIGMKRRVFPES